jgi:hypothetical protein
MKSWIFFLSLRLVRFQIDEDFAKHAFQVGQLPWARRSFEVDIFDPEDSRFCPNDLPLEIIFIFDPKGILGPFLLDLSSALYGRILKAAMFAGERLE